MALLMHLMLVDYTPSVNTMPSCCRPSHDRSGNGCVPTNSSTNPTNTDAMNHDLIHDTPMIHQYQTSCAKDLSVTHFISG